MASNLQSPQVLIVTRSCAIDNTYTRNTQLTPCSNSCYDGENHGAYNAAGRLPSGGSYGETSGEHMLNNKV